MANKDYDNNNKPSNHNTEKTQNNADICKTTKRHTRNDSYS